MATALIAIPGRGTETELEHARCDDVLQGLFVEVGEAADLHARLLSLWDLLVVHQPPAVAPGLTEALTRQDAGRFEARGGAVERDDIVAVAVSGEVLHHLGEDLLEHGVHLSLHPLELGPVARLVVLLEERRHLRISAVEQQLAALLDDGVPRHPPLLRSLGEELCGSRDEGGLLRFRDHVPLLLEIPRQ